MASGEVVRLCFDKNLVKAERSYKVKDRAEQVYLIAFVYSYGRKTDIRIERSVTDMLGELRLHNALYAVGYKRKKRQTRRYQKPRTSQGKGRTAVRCKGNRKRYRGERNAEKYP